MKTKRSKRSLREELSKAGVEHRKLLEFTNTSIPGEKLEIIPEQATIKNCCVLGLVSRNNRRYTKEAVTAAIGLYENAAVYLNHPNDPAGRRNIESRIGTLKKVRMEGDKLRADLRYNPQHQFAPTLEWAAENDPDMLGLSHNVEAEGRELQDGTFVIDRIAKVRSVDLVADPATNRNLQEGSMDPELDPAAMGIDYDDGEDPEKILGHYVYTLFCDHEMSPEEKVEKIKAAVDLIHRDDEDEDDYMDDDEDMEEEDMEEEEDDGEDEEDEADDEEKKDKKKGKDEGDMKEQYDALVGLQKSKNPKLRALAEQALKILPKPKAPRKPAKALQESVQHSDLAITQHPLFKKMQGRIDALEAAQIVNEQRVTAINLCKKAKLPPKAITPIFLEQLTDQPDVKSMQKLIEERQHIMGIAAPRSAGPGNYSGGNGAPTNANGGVGGVNLDEFARRVRHGY